jgi:hypothetical protein
MKIVFKLTFCLAIVAMTLMACDNETELTERGKKIKALQEQYYPTIIGNWLWRDSTKLNDQRIELILNSDQTGEIIKMHMYRDSVITEGQTVYSQWKTLSEKNANITWGLSIDDNGESYFYIKEKQKNGVENTHMPLRGISNETMLLEYGDILTFKKE